jgi:hypothetical protein
MSLTKPGNKNRCTAPSIPTFRSRLSSEMARTFGLIPVGCHHEAMVPMAGSSTAIVFGWAAAVPVTERENRQLMGSNTMSFAAWLTVITLHLRPSGNLFRRPIQTQFTRNDLLQPHMDRK